MAFQFLQFEQHNRVAVLRLIAPIDDQNQLIQLSGELSECCRNFKMNEQNLVLVISEQVPGLLAIENGLGSIGSESLGYASLSQSIAECERPVLMGIGGDAVDLGLEMALACDLRIASKTSRFGLRQIKTGGMPWDGGTQRLSRTIGKAKALEMILAGDLIDAEEARRIGLISRVVPAEEVIPTAMHLAREMTSKSPMSLKYCKEAIVKGMELTLEQGLRLEADLYFLMHTTHDREEGIRAFREKRKPQFKGN